MEQDDNPQQPGLAETICLLVARARADVDQAVACKGIVDCTTGVAVVRQVLGTLPITADGAVVIHDDAVYHPDFDGGLRIVKAADYDDDWQRLRTALTACGAVYTADDGSDLPEWVGCHGIYESETGHTENNVYPLHECYSTVEAARAAKAATQ